MECKGWGKKGLIIKGPKASISIIQIFPLQLTMVVRYVNYQIHKIKSLIKDQDYLLTLIGNNDVYSRLWNAQDENFTFN